MFLLLSLIDIFIIPVFSAAPLRLQPNTRQSGQSRLLVDISSDRSSTMKNSLKLRGSISFMY